MFKSEAVSPAPQLWNFSEIFDKNQPLEIDIGCGKGSFIHELALQFPHINYFGIDYDERWLTRKKELGPKAGIPNLRFHETEAFEFLRDCVALDSVHVFYMSFPDPWPKRRHRKRRLFQEEFLDMLFKRLTPNGALHLATDDLDYFTQMEKVTAKKVLPWVSVRTSINKRLVHETIETPYEKKFREMGRPLYYMELKKGA